MTYLVKLSGENYYLTRGPPGYAFARSKKRAVKFENQEAAQLAMTWLSGDLEVVAI